MDPDLPDADLIASSPTALRREAWQRIRPAGGITVIDAASGGWDAGVHAVDRAVDAGAGVLILIDHEEPGPIARAACALFTGGDATTVTPGKLTDVEWMRGCADIRDAMARMRADMGDPARLSAGDPALAVATAAIVRAAARRTPIVMTGCRAAIAALVAQRISAQSTSWAFCAIGDDDPASKAARTRVGLDPWCTVAWSPEPSTVQGMVKSLIEDLDGRAAPA